MPENVIKQKSYNFALKIIKPCNWLKQQKHSEISSQLIRSGTSIGANVEEALAGQSKKDFLNKMSIASKETREANYWLRLLRDAKIPDKEQIQPVLNDSEELIKILTSIVKTGTKKQKNNHSTQN